MSLRRPRPRSAATTLGFESLESRIALDAQGVLTGIDPHFTLSFADDGVSIGKEANVVNARFDAIVPRVQWREAVLQAFQTWAVHTNSDIALVPDGGQAFGTPGASQNDERFGDIRIGATTLSSEVGAVSVPVDRIASGSWLADVVFNEAYNYQSLDDILAIAIHEAGNVFGLEDSSDPNSPLFTGAAPVVRDPTAADIAALQALHGERAPDANETHSPESGPQVTDNDSLANATPLKLGAYTGLEEGSAPTIVFGDIHDAADADFFTLDMPGDYTGAMTVRLRTSGVSLLQPTLQVLNSGGQVVAQSSSNAIGGSLLSVQVPSVSPEDSYAFRITGADPGVFGVGGYSLAVTFDGINAVSESKIDEVTGGVYRGLGSEDLAKLFDAEEDDFFNEDNGANESIAGAVEIQSTPGFVEGARYETVGSIVDAGDVDYYTVKSPRASAGPLDVMTVALRSLDAGGLVPTVRVEDEDGIAVAAETIVNGAGELIVQVQGVGDNKDYFVRVSASDPSGPFVQGNYELTVRFSDQAAVLESVASGEVGGATVGNSHTLYVGSPQLFHFVLSAADAAVAAPAAVVAVVLDDQGAPVLQFGAPPGETRSAPAVLLNPGEYTVEVYAISLDGGPLPAIGYGLSAVVLADHFVGDPSDPTNNPFACPEPELAGFYCYPGGFISADPYLWDDFIASLPEAPQLDLNQVVNLLLGDWWSWVWEQIGLNGPVLAQNDRFDVPAVGAAQAFGFARATAAPNVLANDIDPEAGAVVAVLLSGPAHGALQLDPDGTVHYTPDPGYVGTDHFTYTAHDFVQDSTPSTAYLVVGSGLAGDYNGDGVIDESDGAAWRASYGSTQELMADGNKDLVVNAADYAVWRDAFSAAAQPALAVADSTVEAPAETAIVVSALTPVRAAFRSPVRIPQPATRRIALVSRDAALALLFADSEAPATSTQAPAASTPAPRTDASARRSASDNTEPVPTRSRADGAFQPSLRQTWRRVV